MLQYKDYYVPNTIEELFTFMQGAENHFDIVAGGTDLFAKEGGHSHSAIDIGNIDAFSTIDLSDKFITFGSMTTVQQFLEDSRLVDAMPLMKHAAIWFAERQIRQMATIGGNLANASPTGDMIPPLLALDAVIHTIATQNDEICQRSIAMADFIKGVGKSDLSQGEVIHSVTCPILGGYGCAFKKVGQRRSLCISTVNSAFLVKVDQTGQFFEDVRIAFGGVGPTPVRLKAIEEELRGKPISKSILLEMLDHIPDDVVRSRSRQVYRKTVIRNFVIAGLSEALAECGVTML